MPSQGLAPPVSPTSGCVANEEPCCSWTTATGHMPVSVCQPFSPSQLAFYCCKQHFPKNLLQGKSALMSSTGFMCYLLVPRTSAGAGRTRPVQASLLSSFPTFVRPLYPGLGVMFMHLLRSPWDRRSPASPLRLVDPCDNKGSMTLTGTVSETGRICRKKRG